MKPAIAIHGGAGPLRRDTPAHRAALRSALDAGYAVLQRGGLSLDAVCAAVVELENCGLFNAGRGASRTAAGKVELDASIMEGAAHRAGAVACVSRVRNPVLAARAVMEHSKHVLLSGEGAERFSRNHRITFVPPRYFESRRSRTGTVGAVALDRDGNLAAATSTGGYTWKLPGRIGDSPLIGAGTYADNATCAVSSTGIGEFFIRAVAAYDVAALMQYRKFPLARAASHAMRKVAKLKGEGGLIAVDRRGNVAMPFNSEGMYRGAIGRDGRATVSVR